MASYRIDVTEEAKIDFSHYTAFERKLVVSEVREQLTHEPLVETKNRKSLRDNPIASWELRIGKYRVFYEVNEPAQMVSTCRSQGAQYSFHWGQGGTDMKTIDLEKEKMDLAEVIKIARREPVLLVTPDGKEFCIAEADDFEKEVEALRGSRAFQRFLDERSASARRIPLEDIEAEIEKELAKQEKTA
jgi:mRNA-degrading endonuclease RelE of RelBE toxin-antitoxin system